MKNETPAHWADAQQRRSIIYRLKVELRRIERAGAGHTKYAAAIRRVLGTCLQDDPDTVLQTLEAAIVGLEVESNHEEAAALRQTLSLIAPEGRSRRELFLYYLRKMENDGRGEEPFAQALRRALESPEGPSIESIFDWRELPPSAR